MLAVLRAPAYGERRRHRCGLTPNQVWSWDRTELNSSTQSRYQESTVRCGRPPPSIDADLDRLPARVVNRAARLCGAYTELPNGFDDPLMNSGGNVMVPVLRPGLNDVFRRVKSWGEKLRVGAPKATTSCSSAP